MAAGQKSQEVKKKKENWLANQTWRFGQRW
jgi:hypothetical protein